MFAPTDAPSLRGTLRVILEVPAASLATYRPEPGRSSGIILEISSADLAASASRCNGAITVGREVPGAASQFFGHDFTKKMMRTTAMMIGIV